MIAVPPGCELGALRFPDPHEFETLGVARDADVPGRCPHAGAAVEAFTFLDRLPAFFQRRKVPTPALPAHNPEASLRGVERESPPDREASTTLFDPKCLWQKIQVLYTASPRDPLIGDRGCECQPWQIHVVASILHPILRSFLRRSIQ